MQRLKHSWAIAMVCGLGGMGAGSLGAMAADPHPTEGPHHGTLIELGDEDFHAELVHDDATETVTFYILDTSATKAVPIVAKKITLNMLAAGKPHQFHLAATPQAGDPDASASAFALADKSLGQILGMKDTTGRLSVEIGEKVYVGQVEGPAHKDEH